MIFFLHCEFFYPCIISFVGIMLFLVTLCCNSCFLFVKNVLRHGHENKQQFIKDITFSFISFSINLYFSHYCSVSNRTLVTSRKGKYRLIIIIHVSDVTGQAWRSFTYNIKKRNKQAISYKNFQDFSVGFRYFGFHNS